ncbi:MAG TPA: isoamylase early set domain-containing protein, partial [Phycisphaerales bacterium]|nr:isoamylase early set domain-containing protein [Phycisphaerales bacterium]
IGPAPTAAATLEPKPARSPIAYGVRPLPEGGGALFVLPATIGKRVSVAGEFNAWSSERTPLELSATGETWEARVPMPPGANQYRLVVDGAWIADPYNPNVAPNPFGGTNSVVMLPPASASNSGAHAKLDPFASTAHAARDHALAAAGRNA